MVAAQRDAHANRAAGVRSNNLSPDGAPKIVSASSA